MVIIPYAGQWSTPISTVGFTDAAPLGTTALWIEEPPLSLISSYSQTLSVLHVGGSVLMDTDLTMWQSNHTEYARCWGNHEPAMSISAYHVNEMAKYDIGKRLDKQD